MIPITTAKIGDNSDLFPDILKLYTNPGDTVIDVTYGKGVFWRKVDTSNFNFIPSDIMGGIDYNSLPYQNEFADALILDPPYMGHNGGINYAPARNYNVDIPKFDKNYIEKLYYGGIKEARRVLKNKGILIIKCQDDVMSGKQNLNHCQIINYCVCNGFIAEDIFILIQKNTPIMRHDYQVHARKNHSYFVVFRKKDAQGRVSKSITPA